MLAPFAQLFPTRRRLHCCILNGFSDVLSSSTSREQGANQEIERNRRGTSFHFCHPRLTRLNPLGEGLLSKLLALALLLEAFTKCEFQFDKCGFFWGKSEKV